MTLKAYSEAIKLGTRLRVLEHWNPNLVGKTRTVCKVQTNGYFFRNDDETQRMWAPKPRASELKFDGTHIDVQMSDPGESHMHWRLEILKDA